MKKINLPIIVNAFYIFLATASLAHAADIPLNDITGVGQFQVAKPQDQLGTFVSTMVNTVTVMAGLAFILYFAMGGLKWIVSSGDKGRAEEAKTELTQSAIGLIVVAVSYFIVGIVGGVVGINILNPSCLLDPTHAFGICK